MSTLSRRTVTALAIFSSLSAMSGMPAAAAGKNDIAQELRAGGLVIVVRHGATFPDQADTDPLNFDNIAAQRNLNDKGKALAKSFGDVLRQARVPVGKVYTSKYNRAYETAVIAGFADIEAWDVPNDARYDGPTLFIAGATSGYIQPTHRPVIRAPFPKGRFVTLKNAGHWLLADNPAGFVAVVEAFLTGTA